VDLVEVGPQKDGCQLAGFLSRHVAALASRRVQPQTREGNVMTNLFARLSFSSRRSRQVLCPRRARRHSWRDQTAVIAAEQLETRILLSATAVPKIVAPVPIAPISPIPLPSPLPYNDSYLSPPAYVAETEMPNLPVFNVMSYGATGNGKTDDTVAIRNTIAAAEKVGGGIIFFPTGTYDVAPQASDAPTQFPAIFTITSSNLVFLGMGATKSILSGYMPGLENPVTHWNVTGNSYVQISRFGMFQIDSSAATGPISNIEFRSLNLDGNLGYTGNFTVGGVPSTGDGWDLTSKAIALDGDEPINNVLVFNTTIDNWRGEEVYAGGQYIGSVYLINDDIYGTDGSAVSLSADLVINHTTIGGDQPGDDVYNGVENFDLGAPQQTLIQESTIEVSSNPDDLHGNGIVYLGLSTSSLVVQASTIEDNWYGILFSEIANNVHIEGSTFSNNNDAMITSILGLYPQYPTGFTNFTIQGNTFSNSGAVFYSQDYAGDYSFDHLVINGNTVTDGVILEGGYYGPTWTDFVVENNVLGAGATDVYNLDSYVGTNYALWINNTREGAVASTAGVRISDFTTSDVTTMTPITDETVLYLNSNPTKSQYVTMNPATLQDYPIGFTTTIYALSSTNWVLQANPAWNTFTKNIPVGPNGVTIEMNAQGKFQLVT
jgi:hypothetical protein